MKGLVASYTAAEQTGLAKFKGHSVLLHTRVPLNCDPTSMPAENRPHMQPIKPDFVPWKMEDQNIGATQGLVGILKYIWLMANFTAEDQKSFQPILVCCDENIVVRYLRVRHEH